ncbi:MAG: RHS repeat-associated core domain-containing protein [Bacteroidetes bacterium]|nr:RHS repeat-associated core domain-containing protein [Bacteroidota bacterium]
MGLVANLNAKEKTDFVSYDHNAIDLAGAMILAESSYNNSSALGIDCSRTEARVALVVDRAFSNPIGVSHPLIVTARVRAYGLSNTTAYYDENLNFTVDPRNVLQSAAPVIDKIDLPGAHKIQVDIVSVKANGAAVSCPENVSLEVSIRTSRINASPSLSSINLHHELHNSNADPSLIGSTNPNMEYANADFLLVKWDEIDFVEGYELEWTYVDHYTAVENVFLTASNLDFGSSDFENNASRIFIEDQDFRIPLLYDKGFLVYRLRAAYKPSCNADYLLYSNWTYTSCSTKLSCFGSNYQQLAGHEQGLNWQASRSFAEGGKSKESIVYSDGSLRSRQSVAYVHSDGQSIVAEQYYDHVGRPAVMALPVPGEAKINFHENFNQSSGSDYGPTNFDLDGAGCAVNIDPMDFSSGSSRYYSPSNPDQSGANAYIPDASGYPFSQVEYEPDNTGRIRRQGGMGPNYQLGSGHETKFYYGTPDQDELDRLFGTDVGYARYYKKVVTIDPNGQASISYLDQTENTIATVLTGNVPIGLLPLGGTVDPLTSLDMLAKSAANDPDDEQDLNFVMQDSLGLEMNYHMIYPATDNFLANYDLSIPTYTEACFTSPKAYQPVVQVSTILIDDLCQTPLNSQESSFGAYNINATSNTTGDIDIPNFPSLSAGSYHVSKTLRIDEDAMDQYAEDFVSDPKCATPYSTFLSNELNALNFEPCDGIFADPPATSIDAYNSCITDLGDPANYASQQEYDELLAECLIPYTAPTTCEAIYSTMLIDVSPGGQYGGFEIDANGDYFSDDPLSVFNDNSDPNHPNLLPSYLDGKSTPIIPGGYTTVNELIQNWEESFAHSLVVDHPEYQYYIDHYAEYCDEAVLSNGINTQEYEYLLANIKHHDDLSALNTYYKVILANSGTFDLKTGASASNFPILNEDPYFNQSSLSTNVQNQKTALLAALADINGTGMPLYEYAAYKTHCANWFGNNSSICNSPAYGTSSNLSVKSSEWQALYATYIGLKQQIIYNWANEQALDITGSQTGHGHCNSAIGEQGFSGPPYLLNRYRMISIANGTNFPTAIDTYTKLMGVVYDQSICGIHADIYELKEKRFGYHDPYLLSSSSTGPSLSEVEQEIYASTGICPNALYLKTFLRDVFLNHDPTSTATDLITIDGFTSKLYEAFSGNVPFASFPYTSYSWSASILNSGKLLEIDLNPGNTAKLRLEFDANSLYSWNTLSSSFSIKEVRSLVPDPSLNSGTRYGFAMELELDVAGVTMVEVITGTINDFNIETCPNILSSQSHGNAFSSSLQGLLSLLIKNGTLTSSNVDLLSSSYAPAFEASLRPQLEASVGKQFTSFNWSHSNSTEFYITTNDPHVSFRFLFCSSPSYNFAATDFHFEDFKEIDPAANPICTNLSFTPNFEVKATSVSYPGLSPNLPVETMRQLYGYFDAFDPSPIGGGPAVTIASLNMGYIGRPLESNPGSLEDCERLIPVRVALQNFINSALSLDYSEQIYFPGGSGHIIDPILFNQLGTPSWFSGTQNQSIAVPYYSAFENANNPSDYFGVFYAGHGKAYNPTMLFDAQTGEYTPELGIFTYNADGLYDCQIRMHFVDQHLGYSFEDVTAFSNLQGLQGTFQDGLTNQFSIWVLVNNMEWVEVHGTSCFQISECWSCTEIAPKVPTNCWEDFDAYQLHVETALGLEPITQEQYCDLNIGCLDEYITYLQRMNINDFNSPYFIPLSDFCNGNMEFYADDYYDYMPIILGAGTAQNFSAHLPTTYTGQFVLIDEFAAAGVSANCISNYSTYLSGASVPQSIVSFCSAYSPVYPCAKFRYISTPNRTISGNPCDDNLNRIARQNALIAYNSYREAEKEAFKSRYIEHILSSSIETFIRQCSGSSDEHITLYFYDQANNLVRTLPPKAISPMSVSSLASVRQSRDNNGSAVLPSHNFNLATNYVYNSLGNLTEQETPDGGKAHFWYDALGRLVLSQNAQQLLDNKYSYSSFDALGRIVEAGQFESQRSIWELMMYFNHPNWPRSIPNTPDLEEVFHTFYSYQPFSGNPVESHYQIKDSEFTLENLQNRVAVSTFYELIPNGGQAGALYDHATWYSYDEHGNVQTLVQDFLQEFPNTVDAHMRFKRINYYYDLISGNVNQVIYQEGEQDQFLQSYVYDDDNRLMNVQSSKDGLTWDQDVNYNYLSHGPLARVELGAAKVQGLDYAYTLQGWLKAVNSSLLEKAYDQGSDAVTNHVARDAFGFSLHYNNIDYSPISGTGAPFLADISSIGASNLFNGNIKAMVTSFWDNSEDPVKAHANRYRYDQLNRLRESHVYHDRNTGTDLVQSSNSFASATSNNDYRVTLSYDANGNILTANRKGVKTGSGTQGMDNMTYHYLSNSNKLDFVADVAPAGNYPNDADGQAAGNYSYDAIGNITSNTADHISEIKWTVSGKVKEVLKSGGNNLDLKFRYDATGNRVVKEVIDNVGNSTKTYYVRDASGNTMATYTKQTGANPSLREWHIYGSDRLGVWSDDEPQLVTSYQSCAPNTPELLTQKESRQYWGLCYFDGVSNQNFGIVSIANSAGAQLVHIKAINGDLDIISQNILHSFTNMANGATHTTFNLKEGASILVQFGNDFRIRTSGSMQLTPFSADVNFNFGGNYYSKQDLKDNFESDHKQYELKNHLGNVLATVADYKYWKPFQETTLVIDEDFSQAGHLVNYSPLGDAILSADHSNGLYNISAQAAGDGIMREFNMTEGCTYQLCISISFEELAAPLNLRIMDGGQEIESMEVSEAGQYCFDLIGGSGNYSLELFSGAEDFFSLEAFTMSQSCEVEELIADVLNSNDYYPFGMVMPGRSYQGSDGYRYGFNGMEKDDEMKGDANSLDFGARIYDPRIGRWMSLDPLASKYPGYSPYHFAYCNPVIVKDPNGKENIIIVGNQGISPDSDAGYDNKRHFLEAGLNEALLLARQDELSTTLLVYKGDYTKEELSHYQKIATESGVEFKIVETAEEVVNYIDNKNGGMDSRDKDLITDLSIISHGSPRDIYIGNGSGTDRVISVYRVQELSDEAFSEESIVKLNSCRSCNRTWGGDNLADAFAEKASKVLATPHYINWGKEGLGSYDTNLSGGGFMEIEGTGGVAGPVQTREVENLTPKGLNRSDVQMPNLKLRI